MNVTRNLDVDGTLDVDGNTELDDVNVSGDLSVAEKIVHAGDTDSYIKFTDNQIDIQTNAANKVRIGAGASIGIHEDAIRALTIGTGNQNNVLIRPNNGASNNMGNSDAVNNLIVMRVPYGESASSQSNAGLRVGMMMRLYNGNAGFGDIDPNRSASLYAVSEDPTQGYSRIVGLAFYTSAFNASQTEALRISGTGGNVGIGTSGPTHKLEVNGNTLLKNNLTVSGISTFNDVVSITAPESTDAILELIADEGDDNTDKWRIRSDATGNNLKFETYASGSWSDGTPLRIASNGYVTIAGALVVDDININAVSYTHLTLPTSG